MGCTFFVARKFTLPLVTSLYAHADQVKLNIKVRPRNLSDSIYCDKVRKKTKSELRRDRN